MERDMTKGSPAKIIFSFTIPVFLGNIFQQFYSMVDTVIVGKFVGTPALAAVGSTGTISFFILGFLMGTTVGFTVLTSQRFGAGDMAGMRKTVGTATLLSLLVSLIMTIASMLGMRSLLTLMNTPADIFADAYTYIMIICAGIFAQVLYNLLSCILRALGNSRTPLYFLIFSAFLNIILDLLLIISFQMGVAGAAIATVVSQGVSGILCLIYIIKKVPLLRLQKEDWIWDSHLAKMQMGVGFPMALQYSITAIGTMMMQSSLNLLGSLAVAAFTAASKIEQLVTQAYVALGTTIATYSAQNTGAGDIRRVRQGFHASTQIGFVCTLIASAFVMTVGKYMTYLFVSENVSDIIGLVDIYLKCAGAFFLPLAVVNIYRNGIQGMGFGLLPMMGGVTELAGRGVVSVAAARQHSYLGVCMASPTAWVLAAVFLLLTYFHIMRTYDKKAADTEPSACQLCNKKHLPCKTARQQ